jgi:tetratricopeptide (TPR) repeat protein
VPLLCSTTQLDRAIERLDPVIAQFPGLISARYARGTAHLRKWLNSAPIQAQQLRSGPLTYCSRFASGTVGEPQVADTLALHRARRDFAAILERELLPRTMAHLAVLEAYAGCLSSALKRAEQALRLVPEDPAVRNQLGVIRFLAGDVTSAASDFEHAAQFGEPRVPWLLFNRAKCAALLGEIVAKGLLREYLRIDLTTDWRREILELLGEPLDVAGHMMRDPPSVFPGLTLQTLPEQIIQRYGAPAREERWRGFLLWHYDALGLDLVLCPARGTIHLELCQVRSGEIEGIQVGDPVRAAMGQWGSPVESGEGQLVFWTGEWGIGLEYDTRRTIVTLSLGALR